MGRPGARIGSALALAVIGAALLGAPGCRFDRRQPMHPESPPGAWYVVSPGETLDQIAARAGVPAEDILELNGLERADQISAGRLIYILDGRATSAGAMPPDGEPRAPAAVMVRSLAAGGTGRARFRWPLDGARIGSPFGARDGHPHDGIDLPAPIGTPVHAAAAGQVVYAGDAIRGYGNLIVLQHDGDLMTVYAHNSVLLVRQGQRVGVGQPVALVGQSGRATGPHLHFEVREGQIPKDPMSYLPGSGAP
jgi:murein DD-endopeptidase MepM/ murein hydrolase activator NlpD